MPRTGLSIPSKVSWAVLLSTFACTLAALVMYQHRAGFDARAQTRHRLVSWADLGAWQVGEATGAPEAAGDPAHPSGCDTDLALRQFRRWSSAVLQYPQVLGTALVAHDGQVLARFPESVGIDGFDTDMPADTRWIRRSLFVGGTQRDVDVVVSPIHGRGDSGPAGTVVLLASAQTPSAPIAGTLTLVTPVVGVGALAVVLVSLWARSALGRSLKTMARSEGCQGPDWAGRLPTRRNDELGAIARNLQRLAHRAAQAEARIAALERSVHVHVADKTRQIEVMLQQARKEAWLDSLTKLYNRRFLDEKLQQLLDEQLAAGEDITLILFDIDHFKTLNDALGHSAGDKLLSFTGELLRASLRGTDIGVRYGGDEFAIIMLGASAPEGSALAQRVVRLFAQRSALFNIAPAVSMSAGVASVITGRTHSAEHLVRLADKALYRAKRKGRNTVQSVSV